MNVVRAAIVVLFLAAVVGAGVIISHDPPPDPAAGTSPGYTAPPQGRVLAVLGDSYSAGSDMGGTGEAGWPAQLAALNRFKLYNDSVPGTGYVAHDPGAKPFPERVDALLKVHPYWVIVWAARDDVGRPLDKIAAAMRKTLNPITKKLPDAHVVVIGPAWINGNVPKRYLRTRDTEKAVAQREGVLFLDPIAEGWFKGDNAAFIGNDRVHPTDQGHQHILFEIQNDLDKRGMGKEAARASDAVPPYVPTATVTSTPPPKTVTATRTTTATATATVTAPGPTVTETVPVIG